MPELPEVETTRVGLAPLVIGTRIARVVVRDRRLRWPIPKTLAQSVSGRFVLDLTRRGKYLLWNLDAATGGGFLLCHLGMSGSLTYARDDVAAIKHDHLDIVLDSGGVVRYHDPRRFGAVLWISGSRASHPLLDSLGPEPLGEEFSPEWMYNRSRGKRQSIKAFLMDAHNVVGIGNIYASESLFLAGLRPTIAAGRISKARYATLVSAVRETLTRALAAGGTSLRDYVQVDGSAGYFQLSTMVYDRHGLPCLVCKSTIRQIRQAQRSTYYCAQCQR